VRAAINRAVDAGMLSCHAEGELTETPFGQAVAAKGCSIATARELAAWIHESETRTWSDIDLLLAVALSPDGRMPLVSLTAKEYDHADYPGELKRFTLDEDLAANTPLNRLRNCNLTPFFEEVRAIKMALLMVKWLEEATIYDLEEEFHVLHGQIISATEQLGWLLDATAAVATAFGAQERFILRIQDLALRLQWGLREEVMPLVRLGLPGLDRNALLALEGQGFHTVEGLAAASPEALARWVGKANARALKTWTHGQVALTAEPHAAAGPTPMPPQATALVIDDRHPGQILVEGKPVRVQDKQYRLIRILAEAPGECVPYESIYQAVWGDAIVEPNQMHFQKRRLLDRVKDIVPHRDKLVTTVPKRGFVLDLAPHEVALSPMPAATPAA
jgi:DNA-binding winged helix-turn-helix (wHTH) protein